MLKVVRLNTLLLVHKANYIKERYHGFKCQRTRGRNTLLSNLYLLGHAVIYKQKILCIKQRQESW